MEKLLFDQLKELQVMANKENLFEAVKYLAEIIDQNFDKIFVKSYIEKRRKFLWKNYYLIS